MSDWESSSIVLVGPMGAGKSHVGRLLAQRSKLPFYDSDDELESFVQMSIPDIFAAFGEGHFRSLERSIVHHLLATDDAAVLSLGGGAFVQEEVRILCRHYRATTVYLQTTAETSWERIKDSENRPLLNVENPVERLRALLKKRKQHYESASHIVSTDSRSPEAIVDEITDLL
jgi:shikimate kinase